MSENINRDEWLKALSDAGMYDDEDDTGAITTQEYAAMMGGLHFHTASQQLARLVSLGKATRTRKWGVTPYGRRIQYAAFRLV